MATAILSSLLYRITNLDSQTTKLDLHQLKQALLNIQTITHEAEKKEMRDFAVKHWLHQLRDALYDAEDALDEHQLQLLSPQEVISYTHLQTFHHTAIKAITETLDTLSGQWVALHPRNRDEEEALDCEFSSLLTNTRAEEMVVYGRDEDRKRVVELLVSEQRSELAVVPIVGVGGIGKTALAELVYNDAFVLRHFDVRGWVCVSEDFNLVRLLGAVLVSVTGYPSFYPELSSLQARIRQKLEGKRFMLVLDDVWNEDHSLWECLMACLTDGLKGSIVLVTTRNASVARIVQTVPFYHVERLSEEDCWSVFQHCALRNNRDPNGRRNLVAIGKEIVKKVRGIPLAAKMVGSLLTYETNEQVWYTILHSDLWGSDDGIGDVVSSAITLNYHSLPAHLKRCFAYCALFPKDYLFKRDPLMRLWMAEGFILQEEGKHIEDVVIVYFDELFRRSFFQHSQIDQETFVMHDLIHDFSRFVSGKETYKTRDGNLSSVTSETRVLSLIPEDFEAEIQIQSTNKPRGLRTFILTNRLLSACAVSYISGKKRLHMQIPDNLFINFKSLRTLDLSETDISDLPDSVANLKHLRFLGLNHTRIRCLPESICSLFYLQTLELRDCNKLVELPRGIKYLTNLRRLDLPRYFVPVPVPPGIGLLTNLQMLSPFYVGYDREHSVIAELKDLVNLRGELSIGGLQNVTNADYARGVLKDKQYLTSLILHSGMAVKYYVDESSSYDYSIFGGEVEDSFLSPLFGENSSLDVELHAGKSDLMDDAIKQSFSKKEICGSNVVDDCVEPKTTSGVEGCKSSSVNDWVEHRANKKNNAPKKVPEYMEEDVFEGLQPHTNLRELVILDYHSVKFPNWLGDPSFTELVSITLDSFSTCNVLPPLGQLPSLRHLVIEYFSALESIGHAFYGQYSAVTGKKFPSLETLQFRSMYNWVEWYGVEDYGFPRLHQLDLNYCPKLRRMPYCLPSLKKLVVWSCDKLIFLPILPSLTSLELLGHCKNEIWSFLSCELLAGLHSLKIHGFKDLTSVPICNMYALTELEISNCQDGENSCSSFVKQLPDLASLEYLKIHYCPGIRFSENMQLPSTLQLLDIICCPLLEEWCQGDGISRLIHIPRVIVDRKDFYPV